MLRDEVPRSSGVTHGDDAARYERSGEHDAWDVQGERCEAMSLDGQVRSDSRRRHVSAPMAVTGATR